MTSFRCVARRQALVFLAGNPDGIADGSNLARGLL